MTHRLARRAQADLEEIAHYVFTESGNLDTARWAIEAISSRFHLLAQYPFAGRARDHDLGQGRRSFPVGSYVIVYRVVGPDVLILRVAHSRRDLQALLRGWNR